MKKEHFCRCIEAMREYSLWERNMYQNGINFDDTPINKVLEVLALSMSDFEADWAYDEKLGINWIVEWCFGESDGFIQKRHGFEFEVVGAGALYDFIVFMNERGWYD